MQVHPAGAVWLDGELRIHADRQTYSHTIRMLSSHAPNFCHKELVWVKMVTKELVPCVW